MATRVRLDTGEATPKQWYLVTNRSEYDRSLVNPGNLAIWLDDASIKDNWTPRAAGLSAQARAVLGDSHEDA